MQATDSSGSPNTSERSLDAQDDGEEELTAEDEPEVLAKLVLTSDAPCNLVVGGASKGLLEAGESLEVEIFSLTVQASATSVETLFARWTEDLELEPDETREISIPMLEAIEEHRKKERRDSVFRDIELGKMWPRRDNSADVGWEEAEKYCADLRLAGFDNWQLPTLEELQTLESMWSLRPLKIADQIVLTACCLWSTTEGSGGSKWNVDFRFRRGFEVNPQLSFGLRALCRRDIPEAELAEARLAADPKEQKRRLKEKRKRLDERRRRQAKKARQEDESGQETNEQETPP